MVRISMLEHQSLALHLEVSFVEEKERREAQSFEVANQVVCELELEACSQIVKFVSQVVVPDKPEEVAELEAD